MSESAEVLQLFVKQAYRWILLALLDLLTVTICEIEFLKRYMESLTDRKKFLSRLLCTTMKMICFTEV